MPARTNLSHAVGTVTSIVLTPVVAEQPALADLIGTVRITVSGAAYVVVGASARWSDGSSNSRRRGWHMQLFCRVATADEAAGPLAERAARLASTERRTDALLQLDR